MSNQQNTQSDDLLEELSLLLNDHKGFVAVGLDMAASEHNWGVCVLAVSRDLNTAELTLLLPQARRNKDGSLSPTLICRPSLNILRAVIQSVADNGLKASLGVDVPFGWPVEHSRFVNGWSALDGWQRPGEQLPTRSDFEKRLTDVELNNHDPLIQPFAVGADTIAQAAYKWANCRSTLGGSIDFGLDDGSASKGVGLASFESYPAAFVNLVYPQHASYKSNPDERRKLLASLRVDYPFACVECEHTCAECHDEQDECNHTCDECENVWLEWAINQKGSPDAYDALLCAITAWGHLRWQADNDRHPMTTPGFLLGTPVPQATKERIHREGWILVPSR